MRPPEVFRTLRGALVFFSKLLRRKELGRTWFFGDVVVRISGSFFDPGKEIRILRFDVGCYLDE